MKKISSIIALAAVGMVCFSACEKQADRTADYNSTEEQAFVRIIHAAPSFRNVFNAPDSFNVFVNDKKVNGAMLTYGGQFPGPGTIYGYFAVPTGLQNIKLSVAGRVTPDSIPLTLFTKLLNKGERYSMIVTDNFKSPTDSAKIIITDSYTKPTNGNYSLRFVHAVLNDTVGKTIDVFSARRNGNIFTGIKPGQIVNFQSQPFNSQVADTLSVFRSGTKFALFATPFSVGNERAVTLIYRGNADLTTTPKARSLAVYVHE